MKQAGHLPAFGAILGAVAVLATTASADWPSKPVRLVVPFAAGGAADVVARLFADGLSGALGQQFIVENRAGGGGLIGAQTVARAEPDGYTLMGAGMSSHVLAPAMSKSPGYDPIRDFTHIAFFGGAPSLILVHPSLAVTSLRDLLAHARASAADLQYVSSGTGTVGNVLVEYIAAKEKLKLHHVPYRSGSNAVIDLLAGRVKLGALNWSTAREHVAGGSLIPLAVSSSTRLSALPDLPTLREIGYGELVTTTWHALSGPAGLPSEVVERANHAVNALIGRPELRRQLAADAIETRLLTPAEVTRFIRDEVATWTPVVRASIKPDGP